MAWTNARGIQIRAKNIPGNLNVLADSLSMKDKVIQTEWELSHPVFNQICHCWHQPTVHLFATKLNHQLPMYVSPVPDSQAWETDALNISWEGLDAYVFCPVALIPQVIQKMTTYRCRIIIIAPGWPGTSWFWDLVDLSTKLPRHPLWVNLLTQPFSNRLHNNLAYLNLHAWHLQSVMKVQEDSQRRWRSVLRSLRHTQRRIYESRWSIFGKWCQESQVDISDPTIPEIANFLNYLFKEKTSSHLALLATGQQLLMDWV